VPQRTPGVLLISVMGICYWGPKILISINYPTTKKPHSIPSILILGPSHKEDPFTDGQDFESPRSKSRDPTGKRWTAPRKSKGPKLIVTSRYVNRSYLCRKLYLMRDVNVGPSSRYRPLRRSAVLLSSHPGGDQGDSCPLFIIFPSQRTHPGTFKRCSYSVYLRRGREVSRDTGKVYSFGRGNGAICTECIEGFSKAENCKENVIESINTISLFCILKKSNQVQTFLIMPFKILKKV